MFILTLLTVVNTGARIDLRFPQAYDKTTALGFAAEEGQLKLSILLLDAGADTEISDMNDRTPLSRAAYNSQTNSIKQLLKHGAKANVKDKDGFTPLHHAATSGDSEAVQMILEAGT